MSFDRSIYRGVITDELRDELAARNAQRLAAAIRALGPRWLGWMPKKPATNCADVYAMFKRKAAK